MNQSDLQYYISHKELLNDVKSSVFKRSGEYAGLRNHGATCYLNSLIQCLFHDDSFVKLVMQCDDNEGSVIISEMKRLFGRLVLSENQAIDTEQLLLAFGWSKSQLFEQHDIHELFSVLLDALGKESAQLSAGISQLFQGHATDVLKCSSCSHESKNETSFLNFSVDMPDGVDATTQHTNVIELLRAHLKPETLDADNMWLCSGCQNKVCATKAQQYSQLPKALMIHLKRFRFDQATKRRRKLATPVYFPAKLNADEIFGSSNFGTYQLSGVVLHSGTAMGGHYRCYVATANGGWVDCNDASVTPLTMQEIEQLVTEPAKVAEGSNLIGKASFVHDNVYMLLYKAVDPSNNNEIKNIKLDELKQLVPSSIQKEIEAENESYSVRFKLQEISNHVVSLSIRVHGLVDSTKSLNTQVDVLKTTTLRSLLEQVHQQLVAEGKLTSAEYPIVQCRLRKYSNRNQSSMGETFGGRENETLEDIGLSGNATLALEVRAANSPEFTEFNPADMNLRFTTWDPANSADGADRLGFDVLVPGREAATVGDLRIVVAKALSVDPTRVVLLHDDSTMALELLDADGDSLMQHRIFPGDNSLVVELAPEGVTISEYKSLAFSHLEERRNRAIIYYNKPTSAVDANVGEETDVTASESEITDAQRGSNYPFSIEVSLDISLSQFKVQVAAALEISDSNSFYCKRNNSSSAPQLKDEAKSLRDLAFVNHSVIYLELGKGCKSGEHMLRVEVDTSSPTAALQCLADGGIATAAGDGGIAGATAGGFIPLGEIAVSEKATVLQLKQQLCAQWSSLASQCADAASLPTVPPSPAYIRLRDGKSGKVSGPLRDDRIVGRCLLGLADGRRLIAQVLEAPECIAADDLVISLRVASFDKRILYPSIDLPVTRSSSMKTLYDRILALAPMLNEPLPHDYLQENPEEVGSSTISIAKGFTSGPALSLKTAFKLKWDEPAVIKALTDPEPAADALTEPIEVVTAEQASGEIDEATLEKSRNLGSVSGLDRPPLNLRDGSIVVVRGKADFWRATLTMRARKAQEEAAGEEGAPRRPTTAGTGAAAARNRKSVKARIAEANANNGTSTVGGDSTGDEVLVKGAPRPSNGSSTRSGPERGIKIATSDRPPAPADHGNADVKISPSKGPVPADDDLEKSMEDLPPAVEKQ